MIRPITKKAKAFSFFSFLTLLGHDIAELKVKFLRCMLYDVFMPRRNICMMISSAICIDFAMQAYTTRRFFVFLLVIWFLP